MKRVYVASKFENTDAVRDAYARLRALGFVITFDWTGCAVTDPGYPHEHAQADFTGVASADLFLLIDHPGMKGAFVELGIALAYEKPVYIVGAVSCVFVHLKPPHRIFTFDTLEAACAAMAAA